MTRIPHLFKTIITYFSSHLFNIFMIRIENHVWLMSTIINPNVLNAMHSNEYNICIHKIVVIFVATIVFLNVDIVGGVAPIATKLTNIIINNKTCVRYMVYKTCVRYMVYKTCQKSANSNQLFMNAYQSKLFDIKSGQFSKCFALIFFFQLLDSKKYLNFQFIRLSTDR